MGQNADAPPPAAQTNAQTNADQSDSSLLRRYVRHESQAAFAELVRRYGGLVHAACLREVGDPQMAEDITQVVFLLLARKAPTLLHADSLAGWLFRAARFSARNAQRRERRRQVHEQQVVADMTRACLDGPEVPSWSRLEPLLNAALAVLRPHEQDVILVRYGEGATWRETAARLGLAEDAAQKRGTRAIDKMRRFVHRHGLTLSVAALTALLSDEAAQAASFPPAMLLKIVGPPGPNAASLYGGIVHAMKLTKITAALGGLAFTGAVTGLLWARPAPAPARPGSPRAVPLQTARKTSQEKQVNPTKTPQDLLTQVRAHYQGLSSFSMNIQHQDDSGLYPGVYTQQLQWQRGGRFELRNTSAQNKALREDLSPANSPRAVPDFVADGVQVMSALPSGQHRAEQEGPRPNSVPGWEVTGGTILSWLQDTPNGRIFLNPPPEMTGTWSIGTRTVWHGQKVRELIARWRIQGQTESSSYFISAKAPTLVGFEWHTGGSGTKIGYALYTDQKENPSLPATLGNAP